jgi:3'-phosphoadenosine 5'-phosphosulfate sulfotransferase (PAPS reductase)/FAD synthetase
MDPYLIPEPALISFSGGRTSGYMLRKILDAHGGTLPKDIRVAFFNTGKEKEETLVFVRECEERWEVPIVWLEYDRVPAPSDLEEGEHGANKWIQIAREVKFETASREGEPFSKLVAARSYLPNVVTRFCTAELKVRTGKRWMIARGYEHWTAVIGIRADEPGRLGNKSDNKERWVRIHPLADAGVCVEDVMKFWGEQEFDLQLRQDQGNCDLCFLKGRKKLHRLVTENPRLAGWWINEEEKMKEKAAGKALAQFSSRRTYRDILSHAMGGPLLEDLVMDDEVEDCHCTD